MSSSVVIFRKEKFDGRTNIVLCKIQVKGVLIQPISHKDNTSILVDIYASCAIRLCQLLKNFIRKPLWKLHRNFSAWISACRKISYSDLASSGNYLSV